MNNNVENQNNSDVINKGKIPDNITSPSDIKSVSRTFKVTQAQNELIKAAMEKVGFKTFSEYVLYKLFDSTPIITIEGGRDILIKLSECAELLNAMGDNAAQDGNLKFNKLIDKFSEIELKISQIFDYIDVIKNELINGTEDK